MRIRQRHSIRERGRESQCPKSAHVQSVTQKAPIFFFLKLCLQHFFINKIFKRLLCVSLKHSARDIILHKTATVARQQRQFNLTATTRSPLPRSIVLLYQNVNYWFVYNWHGDYSILRHISYIYTKLSFYRSVLCVLLQESNKKSKGYKHTHIRNNAFYCWGRLIIHPCVYVDCLMVTAGFLR